jgi:hypothetical protein
MFEIGFLDLITNKGHTREGRDKRSKDDFGFLGPNEINPSAWALPKHP